MRLALLFLMLIICAPAFPQEKSDAPRPKTEQRRSSGVNGDRAFWIGTAALAGAKAYDAIETRSLLDRGGWENNPIYGRHPSPAKQAGINAGIFAAEVTLFHFTERSKHKTIRWLGRGYITFTVVQHVRAGACNAGINRQGPVQNCSAF